MAAAKGIRTNMAAACHSVSPYRASRLGPYLKWRPQASRVLNMVPSVLICLKMAAPTLVNSIPTPETGSRRPPDPDEGALATIAKDHGTRGSQQARQQ